MAKPIYDLEEGECRWPVNDAAPGEEHLFCGLPHGREPHEQPYCDCHAALNIDPDSDRIIAIIDKMVRKVKE